MSEPRYSPIHHLLLLLWSDSSLLVFLQNTRQSQFALLCSREVIVFQSNASDGFFFSSTLKTTKQTNPFYGLGILELLSTTKRQSWLQYQIFSQIHKFGEKTTRHNSCISTFHYLSKQKKVHFLLNSAWLNFIQTMHKFEKYAFFGYICKCHPKSLISSSSE